MKPTEIVRKIGKQHICERHYKKLFPMLDVPENDWEFGNCDYCGRNYFDKKKEAKKLN